jgi:PST family polysaccharide transporter
MSFQSLVRSTILIGSSSVATTLVGILRVKALALLVGPAGVGLLGVLAGIASAGTTIAALGSDTSGTRRLAIHRNDPAAVASIRRALLVIALVHGTFAIAALYMLSIPISRWMLGTESYAHDVGLLGVAVALSLFAGLQIAQLQGLGRVGDIARVNMHAALAGTILGLAAVWQWGISGLILLVLAQPAIAAIVAVRYVVAAVPSVGAGADEQHEPLEDRGILAGWRSIVAHGAPYMVSFLLLALVPLVIRAFVIGELGMEAAGYFHAAWTMSVIYIAFLLNAMSADYFPRLTALAGNRPAARSLVNDQIELGLAVGGVAMIVMLAGAPVLVPLLYSSAFAPAVEIVEWQALGNLMKIAGWPIAFLSMARGRSTQFLAIEATWSMLLVGLVYVGLPRIGLAATGMAFAVSCAAFLALQLIVAYATFGFVIRRSALVSLLLLCSAGILILLAARYSVTLQIGTGACLAVLTGVGSVRFILARMDPGGRFPTLVRQGFAIVGWPMPAPTSST